MRRTRLSLAALAVASVAALGLPAAASAAPAADPTEVGPAGVGPRAAAAPADIPVQLVAMNDFHGRISETTGGDSILTTGQGPGPDGVPGNADDGTIVVGGAAHVASTVHALKASFAAADGPGAASYLVGAGDLISASPFNSSVFKDEPTIEVLNAMGLDVSSVGNHEFDRGTTELRRISAATDGLYSDDVSVCQGVARNVDGCFTDSRGNPFEGAGFPYLAANVVMKDTGAPMLPPFQVFDVGGGRRIALIGVVTDTTPTIVSPAGIADVDFIDEATAVNRWVPTIRAMGIESIGVLVHEGGSAGAAAPPAAPYDGCSGLTGPILDINARTTAAVDFIVSAHSHQAYNCRLTDPSGQPRLVTQAGFYGRLVTDIRLSIDPRTGDVDRTAGAYSATNVPVTRTATDPAVAAIVTYWTDRSAVAGNVVVGQATADILRSGAPPAATRDAESSLGNLVAQSQLEALQADQYGRPVIAFMNPGGLRTDIAAGEVTYSELFNVQPFGNTVNAITLTGADIRQVLEEQFQKDQARGTQLVLGTSAGFRYRYDLSRPYGDRVDACSITLNGQVLDPAGAYRVAANSFLAVGGDSFTAFAHGTDPVTGPVDVDTAVGYFKAHSPVAPPAADHGTATSERLGCGGGGGGAVPTPPTTPAPPVVLPIAGGGAGVAAGTGTGPRRSSSAAGGSLADTGVPVAQLLGLGGALVAAGVALTAAGYRRRRDLAD